MNPTQKFRKEVDIWRRIKHPHILRLYGVCYFGPLIHMVCPWAHNRDISTFIARNPHADRVKLLDQVSDGLAYLHGQSPPIIHGKATM